MGHSELGNKKKKKTLARELVNTCYFSTSILLQIEKNVAELRAEVDTELLEEWEKKEDLSCCILICCWEEFPEGRLETTGFLMVFLKYEVSKGDQARKCMFTLRAEEPSEERGATNMSEFFRDGI